MQDDDPGAEQQPATARRSSLRQASRGTFQQILAHKQREELEFAEFERVTAFLMQHNKRRAPQAAAVARPLQPCSDTATGGDDVVVVVGKRRRGRPPQPKPPESPKPPLVGTHLDAIISDVRAAVGCSGLPVGTPVWVKMTGYCAWPGLIWSLDLCARHTWPEVVTSFQRDRALVRFYGDHSSSWVSCKQLLPWSEDELTHKSTALMQWGKRNNRLKLVNATLNELTARAEDCDEETSRMDRLGRQYQLDFLQATARHRHSRLIRPSGTNTQADAAADADEGAVTNISGTVLNRSHSQPTAGSTAVDTVAAAAAAAAEDVPVTGNAWGVCDVCRDEVPDMRCHSCHRWLHALCSTPAALSACEYAAGQQWTCPRCAADNVAELLPEEELLCQAAGQGSTAERMGLTPDWIISTATFMVFQLPRPTADQPFIAGLLDPACNSKQAPNVPAEVLYDKEDDGLDPNNSWKGYYVLLNPDYRAQVQWRFVNRAIDEVENGNVPAVLLVCRNSTDTAYFQRLRPYPRVLLRRCNTQFKDYDKCPNGFGVVVFCIATAAHKDCMQLYERFYKGFSPFGEPNIPIDTEFLSSASFYQLLSRLRLHAEQYARDHWAQCSKCGVWRIIPWLQQQTLLSTCTSEWTCSMLRPPLTSCATPQTKRELAGMSFLEPAAVPGDAAAPPAAAAATVHSAPDQQAPEPPAAPADCATPHHIQATWRSTSGPLARLTECHSDATVLEHCSTAAGAAGAAGKTHQAGEVPAVAGLLVTPTALDHSDMNKGNSQTPSAQLGAGSGIRSDPLRAAAPGTEAGSGGTSGTAAATTPPAAHAWRPGGVAANQAAVLKGVGVMMTADSAAGLLARFDHNVAQVHHEVATAYLCKSTAGQVSIRMAQDLLCAAGHPCWRAGQRQVRSSVTSLSDRWGLQGQPVAGAPSAEHDAVRPMQAAQLLVNKFTDQLGHIQQQQLHNGARNLEQQQQQRILDRQVVVDDARQQLLQLAGERQCKTQATPQGLSRARAQVMYDAGATGLLHKPNQGGVHQRGSSTPGLPVLALQVHGLVEAWLLQLVEHAVLQPCGRPQHNVQHQPSHAPCTRADDVAGSNKPPAADATLRTAAPVVAQATDAADAAIQICEATGMKQQQKPWGVQRAASPSSAWHTTASGTELLDTDSLQARGQQQQQAHQRTGTVAAGGGSVHIVRMTDKEGVQSPELQPATTPHAAGQSTDVSAASALVASSTLPAQEHMQTPGSAAIIVDAAATCCAGGGACIDTPQLQACYETANLTISQVIATPGAFMPTVQLPCTPSSATPTYSSHDQGGLLGQQQQPVLDVQQQVLRQLMLTTARAQVASCNSSGSAERHPETNTAMLAFCALGCQHHPSHHGLAGTAQCEYTTPAAAPAAAAAARTTAASGAVTTAQHSTDSGKTPVQGSPREDTLSPDVQGTPASRTCVFTAALGSTSACGTAPSPAAGFMPDRCSQGLSAEGTAAVTVTVTCQRTRGCPHACLLQTVDSFDNARPLTAAGTSTGPAAEARNSTPELPTVMQSSDHLRVAATEHTTCNASGGRLEVFATATATADAVSPVYMTVKDAAAAQSMQGPPVCCACSELVLRPGVVWDHTEDLLLRAVLLEQPRIMQCVLDLLRTISTAVTHSHDHSCWHQHAFTHPGGSSTMCPGHCNATSTRTEGGEAVAAFGSVGVCSLAPQHAHPSCSILEGLCSQPPIHRVGPWPRELTAQQDVTVDDAVDSEYELYGVPDDMDASGADRADMLSSLELARAARIAANKAYMLGLGLGPASSAAVPSGKVGPSLAANDATVIAAARRLAQQAAVQRAKQQLEASQRLLDARRRARRQQEQRLRATLDALKADEVTAAQQVVDALRTLQDVKSEAYGSSRV